VTNKRIVKSTVVVENGQTVVLGGLILDDLSNSVDGVIGLSNIPVIGGLFRNKQKKQRKLNLMLFIKPTIIRTKTDLVGFTERKYGDMRGRQIEANERSEYLIRDMNPSVMPPLNEAPTITRLDEASEQARQAEKEEKEKNKATAPADDNCSISPLDSNACP